MRKALAAVLFSLFVGLPFAFFTPHADAACETHIGDVVQLCTGPNDKLGAVVNVPLIHTCIQINRLCGG